MRRVDALDGVRALAVLAVVAYHFLPVSVPGGYLGVDVFFVLSGFLITSLLLREKATQDAISLRGFWERRARRILPAALIVAAAVTALTPLLNPDLRVGIGKQLLGILTFSTNWLQVWSDQSYFQRSEPQLFVHYWSLAVEEQFYLLWPALLAAVMALLAGLGRVGARVVLPAVVAAGAAASALAMGLGYRPDVDPSRLYYGTDTHAFGLLIGATAALLVSSRSPSRIAGTWPTWRLSPGARDRQDVLTVAALGLLAVLLFTLHDTSATAYRGGILAASLAACVVVVTAARGVGAVAARLAHPALVWVGRRSYSLYLVHWPVFLLVDKDFRDPTQRATGAVPILALVLSFALAALCYRWVETPFLRRPVIGAVDETGRAGGSRRVTRFRSALRRAPATVVLVALAVAAGVAVHTAPDQTSTQRQLELAASEAQAAKDAAATAPPKPPSRGMPRGEDVVVIGDSVALGASAQFRTAFPGLPSDQIDAEVSRSWIAVPSLVTQFQNRHLLRDVLVLGIGTNGPAGAEYVRTVLDQVGAGILVVIANAHSPLEVNDSINAGIREAVAGRPNVEVADWHTAISAHPDFLASDDVHPADERGRQLYVSLVQDALRRIVDRTPASPEHPAPAEHPAEASAPVAVPGGP